MLTRVNLFRSRNFDAKLIRLLIARRKKAFTNIENRRNEKPVAVSSVRFFISEV